MNEEFLQNVNKCRQQDVLAARQSESTNLVKNKPKLKLVSSSDR